jgi:pimeloyl-ACP methyl ester carboxylesterase
MRKFPVRLAAIAIAALLVAGVVAALLAFERWRDERLLDLVKGSSLVLLKDGPVEYVRKGEGPAILVFHDFLGGYDQGLALASFLPTGGFTLISPSRPGYLRTPLASGLTPEAFADSAARLLDSMRIENAAVLAFGAGGPTAIEFARRHPSRTRALVMVAAAPARIPPVHGVAPTPQAVAEALTGDVGAWIFDLLARHRPALALDAAFSILSTAGPQARAARTDLVLDRPAQLASFRALVDASTPLSPRESGLRNDLLQLRAHPRIDHRQITCPALFVLGAADPFVEAAAAEAPQHAMPSAKILILPDEGHLVLLGRGASRATSAIVSFLKDHSPPPATP